MSTFQRVNPVPVFSSGRDFNAVTPNDVAMIKFDALYVGTSGDVVISNAETGSEETFASVPGGSILPISGDQVKATGTTASNIIALRIVR